MAWVEVLALLEGVDDVLELELESEPPVVPEPPASFDLPFDEPDAESADAPFDAPVAVPFDEPDAAVLPEVALSVL